jgi:hypothetical protein
MGPRPADFDESVVRQSPTFHKWLSLNVGERLRYACRDFVKGHGDDEERLMRRIMIARRNNLRDHDALKRARAVVVVAAAAAAAAVPSITTTTDAATTTTTTSSASVSEEAGNETHPPATTAATSDANAETPNSPPPPPTTTPITTPDHGVKRPKRRKTSANGSEDQIIQEMDVAAVEATRSYKTWQALEDGKEFVYNQKYVKGKESHDWLLRKNIWRRMRYRRENKKMVEALFSTKDQRGGAVPPLAFTSIMARRGEGQDGDHGSGDSVDDGGVGAGIVNEELLASAAAAVDKVQHIHKSVVDAAVAAAESYVKSNVDTAEHADV